MCSHEEIVPGLGKLLFLAMILLYFFDILLLLAILCLLRYILFPSIYQ